MEYQEKSKRKGQKEYLKKKVVAENFPNLMKTINLHTQEAQSTPSRKTGQHAHRVKLSNDKDKARES